MLVWGARSCTPSLSLSRSLSLSLSRGCCANLPCAHYPRSFCPACPVIPVPALEGTATCTRMSTLCYYAAKCSPCRSARVSSAAKLIQLPMLRDAGLVSAACVWCVCLCGLTSLRLRAREVKQTVHALCPAVIVVPTPSIASAFKAKCLQPDNACIMLYLSLSLSLSVTCQGPGHTPAMMWGGVFSYS